MPENNLTSKNLKIKNFNGPYDLLLELAQSQKIDLSEISLAELTTVFINYVYHYKIPAHQKAEFLMVAATLVLIKIRLLMPTVSREEEEEISQLTSRLKIYQEFRQAASDIKKIWGKDILHTSPNRLMATLELPMPRVSQWQILNAMTSVVKKQANADITYRVIKRTSISLPDALMLLRSRLKLGKQINLHHINNHMTPHDLARSMQAALELVKRQEASMHQDAPFSPISISIGKK